MNPSDSAADLLSDQEEGPGHLSPTALFKLARGEQRQAKKLSPNVGVDRDSSIWPLRALLQAEALLAGGESQEAGRLYGELARSGMDSGRRDESAYAVIAFWRWLGLESDADFTAEEVLEIGEGLLSNALSRRVFRTPVLSSLPQIQEDLLRRLALFAYRAGRDTEAGALFIRFLKNARQTELGSEEEKLRDRLVEIGFTTEDRMNLALVQHLRLMGKLSQAEEILTSLRTSSDRSVRAEANLEWARIQRARGEPKGLVGELFGEVLRDATDSYVIQQALWERGLYYNREGAGRRVEHAREDWESIITRFPYGHLADDALYELARSYQLEGDLGRALEYFGRLRSFEGQNNWINSSYYQPALAVYTEGSREAAAELLTELVETRPGDELHVNALFWLGRIFEERNQSDKSREYFRQVVEAEPFGYYGLRARFHLRRGRQAAEELSLDADSRNEVIQKFRSGSLYESMTDTTPFHRRLKYAIDSGLYSLLLEEQKRFRERFSFTRLEEVPLSELASGGFFSGAALLVALRQDAFAARDSVPEARNHSEVASVAGHKAGDLPLGIALVKGVQSNSTHSSMVQSEPNYIRVAYPLEHRIVSLLAAAAKAHDVPVALLYSVARNESLFDPATRSAAGALGLFQFKTLTFNELSRRFNLLEDSPAESATEYLLRADLAADLGARWFAQLLSYYDNSVALAVMEHNAGRPAVLTWRNRWSEQGRISDFEYLVETARFAQTRILLRSVIADFMVTEILFDESTAR